MPGFRLRYLTAGCVFVSRLFNVLVSQAGLVKALRLTGWS